MTCRGLSAPACRRPSSRHGSWSGRCTWRCRCVGLWLLLAQPATDLVWQHHAEPLLAGLAVAAVNVGSASRMSAAAPPARDARLFLVSLAFLTSAGFLLLHALATPGVLVGHPNAGFDLAQPVGLALASVFAVGSSLRRVRPRPRGRARCVAALRAAVGRLAVLLAWRGRAVSLLDLPPLNAPAPDPRRGWAARRWSRSWPSALYVVAAVRFYLLHRRAPAAVLLSLVTAFALLAEAMVAVDRWPASGTCPGGSGTSCSPSRSGSSPTARTCSTGGRAPAPACSTRSRSSRRRAGSGPSTARRWRSWSPPCGERERTGPAPPALAARLADRFGLTEGQAAVLDRAGAALATERGLTRRLSALVEVGRAGPGRAGDAGASWPRCCAGSGRRSATSGSG